MEKGYRGRNGEGPGGVRQRRANGVGGSRRPMRHNRECAGRGPVGREKQGRRSHYQVGLRPLYHAVR
jgi:hypothetical protein